MINNVVLVGRLTRDADLKYTQNGTAVATFSLAVNRNFSNQNGEKEADFINCVVWRKPAETFCNYTKKGSMVAVQGRIQTRNYENQQGQRVYVTEIIVESFQFINDANSNLENSNDASKNQAASNPYSNEKPAFNFSGSQTDMSTPFEHSSSSVPFDNDLPF